MDNDDLLTEVVDLNVGGVFYSTTLLTLTKHPATYLGQVFTDPAKKIRLPKDRKGRYFIDRDGVLFRFILDYLRTGRLLLPDTFCERDRLKAELVHFQLTGVEIPLVAEQLPTPSYSQLLPPLSPGCVAPEVIDSQVNGTSILLANVSCNDIDISSSPSAVVDKDTGHITIGYRGTFAFGRDGVADVKFRKLTRILVCGRVSLCRRVFGETLNESRDPDRGLPSRYTSRFYLKHTSLEHAFDMLQDGGFRLLAACASGTSTSLEAKTSGQETDESKWNHYNEFVFCKP